MSFSLVAFCVVFPVEEEDEVEDEVEEERERQRETERAFDRMTEREINSSAIEKGKCMSGALSVQCFTKII